MRILTALILASASLLDLAGAMQTKHIKKVTLAFASKQTSITIDIESDRPANEFRSGEFDQFNTSIVNDFSVPTGIEKETAEKGFKLNELKTYKGNSEQSDPYVTNNFSWGQVYTWRTPTRGSATFSYICRKKEKFCFKIGPYQDLYWQFDWNTIAFSKLPAKE